jgi:hypothetical protein
MERIREAIELCLVVEGDIGSGFLTEFLRDCDLTREELEERL